MAEADANLGIIDKLKASEHFDITPHSLLEFARWTETAERYGDMCEAMKLLVENKRKNKEELSVEQRNMLSVAYKNVVGKRRQAWRQIKGEPEADKGLTMQYRKVIEGELTEKCNEVLNLLKDSLIDDDLKQYWVSLFSAKQKDVQEKIKSKDLKGNEEDELQYAIFQQWIKDAQDSGKPVFVDGADQGDIDAAKKEWNHETHQRVVPAKKDAKRKNPLLTSRDESVETLVFYLKMCGDYYRYLAEFDLENKSAHADKSGEHYEEALCCANSCLSPTHPTRLGLSLNMSVCYYEIKGETEKACELANKAFNAAISKLDSLNDTNYKDSTLIMQLLRDNLTIWKKDNPKDAPQED